MLYDMLDRYFGTQFRVYR